MKANRLFALLILGLLALGPLSPFSLAAEEVAITIKGGSIAQGPAQLYANTDYVLVVTVLDAAGNPRPGVDVSLSIVGPGAIIGQASATTDQGGVARLQVRFDDVGTLQLFVAGSRVGRILIYYSSVPVQVIGYPLTLVILLLAATLYTAYKGPLSLAMRKGQG
jgi:hypothetical protein